MNPRPRPSLITSFGAFTLFAALPLAIAWAAGVDRFGILAIITAAVGALLVIAGARKTGGTT